MLPKRTSHFPLISYTHLVTFNSLAAQEITVTKK
jgi:hypothetical protein